MVFDHFLKKYWTDFVQNWSKWLMINCFIISINFKFLKKFSTELLAFFQIGLQINYSLKYKFPINNYLTYKINGNNTLIWNFNTFESTSNEKKIKFFAIYGWFAPGEKKLNLFINFLLIYKILNQNAIFLYNRYTVNLQIDEIDKIRSFSFFIYNSFGLFY